MTEKSGRPVTVFGGSGFLGREIVRHLVGRGFAVRVAVRHPAAVSADESARHPVAVRADVRDESSVAAALRGAEAAVNAVGHYVERQGVTFEAVHGQGARNVARAAGQVGVKRLIHISGIGADPESESSYVRSRARGEALVREAFPDATIFRPSVLFGPGDALIGTLAKLGRWAPVIPLFGDGRTKLQPVYLGDVAEAVVRALERPASRGGLYELGGPAVYSYRALVELVLEHLGTRRLLLPLPFALWDLQARLLGLLPSPPLTRDQVALMKHDNVVAPRVPSLADLGIAPTALEAVLTDLLGSAR